MMRLVSLFLTMSLLALLPGCEHCWRLSRDSACETPCATTTATPCPSTPAPCAPATTVTCPAPHITFQQAPATTITMPQPQITVQPAAVPAAPPAVPQPLFVPQQVQQVQPLYATAPQYAAPAPTVLVMQPPSQSLALILDWFSVSLPLPRLGVVPSNNVGVQAQMIGGGQQQFVLPQPQLMLAPAVAQQPAVSPEVAALSAQLKELKAAMELAKPK